MTRSLRLAAIVLSLSPFSPSLAGELTPQQQKMKECNAEAGAKGLLGDAQQKFMSACLSAKATEGKGASKQDRVPTCNKDADAKGLKGNERKQFMQTCLSPR
jgi:hypothetical protein